jgi:hypothetical protein
MNWRCHYVASDHPVLPYALPYFVRISLLRTPFSTSLYSLESLWNSTWDSGKIQCIWPIFERQIIEVAPTVPEVHLVTNVAALRYFGHNSLLRTLFWAILYLLERLWNSLQDSEKSWAFEHFLSVGSSGASHFYVNTSLYVSRKSIGWTDVIIWWYHQIIQCLYTCFFLLRSSSGAHKNGTVGSSYALFSTHLNLGITFHSGFRFWWSWTLWKACGIIFMIL